MKNITLNGAKLPLPSEIPYSSAIAGGMKVLARQQAAIEKLFLYEESGKTPYEIHIMQERMKSLEKRIRKLESYD